MFSISVRHLLFFCVIISLSQAVPLKPNRKNEQVKVPLIKEIETLHYNYVETYNNEDDYMNVKGINLPDAEMQRLKIWPQGIIPYYIDTYSYKDKVVRDRIRDFLGEVNSQTNINFMELPSPPIDEEDRWVFFVNRRGLLGCADHSVTNFTTKGVQHVILGYDCMSTRNELAQAVLSIVGVPSQHNAPNRDEYIEVITENIIPEKRYLFNKISEKDWLFGDVDYDFKSASHFDSHKHSRNGKATIRIKDKNLKQENIEKSLSQNDIKKIKMLYKFAILKKTRSVDECQKLFLRSDVLHKQQSSSVINSNQQFQSAGGTFQPWNANVNVQDSSFGGQPGFGGRPAFGGWPSPGCMTPNCMPVMRPPPCTIC